MSPLGDITAIQSVALYRVFAHRFNWSPETVDAQPVRLLAAFQHDFEAERIRLKMASEKEDTTKYNQVKGRRIIVDRRIPLSVRVLGPHLIEAWVIKHNKETGDDIPRPEIVYDLGDQIPNAPDAT